MRIQGTFNFTIMTWTDDNGNSLAFTQFVTEGYIPSSSDEEALFIKYDGQKENYTMGQRAGEKKEFITTCVV
jgi:hypothetical protein